jgi:hypothetical protein
MMQNAVIYNSAAFRVADVWLRRIRGHEVGGDAEFAEMEVESSDTFNTLLRNSSNPELLPILKAELLSALGKCREAVQEFEDYFGGEAVESLQRYNAKLLAEHAYCVAYLGRLEEADMLGKKALAQIENCRDFDDLAVVHHCLGTVGEHLGQAERSEYHFEARDLYLSEFARIQEEARQEISSIDLDFGEKLRTKKSPA